MKIFLLFLLLSFPAFALNVDKPLPNAAEEARAQALFSELRCVVCEGEAIADSPAGVAHDMRAYVRVLISEGKSDEEIRTIFTGQYGDQVLMKPPVGKHRFLWIAPLLLLGIGIVFSWRNLFREKK